MDSSTQMSPVNNSASMASLVSGIAGWVIFLINVCVNLVLVPALTVITLGIGALLYLCILPLTCISPIAWIIAVVTGHVGMSQTKAAGQQGNSKATAGLILGYLGLAFVVLSICLIVVAVGTGISIPILSDIINQY